MDHSADGPGFANGGAAGSASPLTWSAASFVRLTADLAAKRNVALPAVTQSRYVSHTQGTTTLTVTSPLDNSAVSASPVTVTGITNATAVAAVPAGEVGGASVDAGGQ